MEFSKNCPNSFRDIVWRVEAWKNNNNKKKKKKKKKKPTRQSEGQLYLPLQNDNGAASKFKAQKGGLQLWPWPWVCIVELWVLHMTSLRRTFHPNLINIFLRVQEIWSEHEIWGSNSWPFTVTLTLSQHASFMGSAHHLTKTNISPKFNKYLSKGSGDMEWTWNLRLKLMTFHCDLDLGSACFSYGVCTSPH